MSWWFWEIPIDDIWILIKTLFGVSDFVILSILVLDGITFIFVTGARKYFGELYEIFPLSLDVGQVVKFEHNTSAIL